MLTAITINLSLVLCEQMYLISLSHLGVWDKIIDFHNFISFVCIFVEKNKFTNIIIYLSYWNN